MLYDPLEEGKLAASKGKPTNPYPPGSEPHEVWAEGYNYTTVAEDAAMPAAGSPAARSRPATHAAEVFPRVLGVAINDAAGIELFAPGV
jgi:hypothetical protein